MEDIHMVIEDALIKRIGEPGRKLHTGRSRNDQVATDLVFWIRNSTSAIGERFSALLKALVALADRSTNIVMPSFTHLQRAQPIQAGADALAWASAIDRSLQRFYLLIELAEFPLGSGAIAGSSLPLDREFTLQIAESMNLVGDPDLQQLTTSIDGTANRDLAADFLFGLAMTAMTLSRWAEQWIIYMTTEFGFIKIADRYTTSSSMMPQKRNPDMLELIRGRCGNVYGDLFALMTILKGLPIGYNRDLQEDKRIVFRAYDTVSSCLTMAAAIVNSANYDKERIEPTLDRGFLDATSLAEYFVTKGIPFRTAHQIVGMLVARCEREKKVQLSELSVAEFIEAVKAQGAPADQIGTDIYQALGAKNVVARYRSAGAAGGQPFLDQLAAWKRRLGMGA
jgi:argininosuccinate lyase